MDYPMPCHITIDYEDADWQTKWEKKLVGRLCAGAAIFFANICKLSRESDRLQLPADRETVFAWPAEFLAHHKQRGA